MTLSVRGLEWMLPHIWFQGRDTRKGMAEWGEMRDDKPKESAIKIPQEYLGTLVGTLDFSL